MRYIKIAILFIIFVALNIWVYAYFKQPVSRVEQKITYGVTFSKPYAEYFKLDWRKAYLAVLDDLKVRAFRIPAYWDMVEPEEGKYNFSDLDWMLSEAEKRDAEIILAIGRKLPRWPECFVPGWAKLRSETAQREKILGMLQTVVMRYKNSKAVKIWQVENEPLLPFFGECPAIDKEFLKQEVALVKSLDSRPVMITESGELSTWITGARMSDVVGVSMYFVVWNKYWGYFHHHFPVAFYTFRSWVVEKILKKPVILTEMQAEPWGVLPAPELSVEEQLKSMNVAELEKDLAYVKKTGFSEVYLWGVEWWYWLKEKHGINDFWEKGKTLFR